MKIFKLYLNNSELILGFLLGISFYPFLYSLSLGLALVCALWWSFSGAGASKLFRRLGVPSISAMFLFIFTPWILVSVPLAFLVLSQGYGMVTKYSDDKGSRLGRFFDRITNHNEFLANICTRLFLAACLWLSFFPLAFVDLIRYSFCGMILTIGTITAVILVE